MKTVATYLRDIAVQQASESQSDGQLLDAYLRNGDPAAFEAILRRHGPMVLGVCRRILRDADDAEDAFQATFLVLVRKAATIRPRSIVGNWLYGVAWRTAQRAQTMNIRRRRKEQAAAVNDCQGIDGDRVQSDLLCRLDSELTRLPQKYRVPIVLCELEGKSRKEASRLLGLPEGTLSWRLAQGRKLLARKLSSGAGALSATGLSAALTNAASGSVPAALLASTSDVAMRVAAGQALTAGTASTNIITLTEGVTRAMFLSKFKVVSFMALLLAIGAGSSGVTYRVVAASNGPADEPRQGRVIADELEAMRLQVEALRLELRATRERVKVLENRLGTDGERVSYLVAKQRIESGTLISEPEKFFIVKTVAKGDEPKGAIKTFGEIKDRRINKLVLPERFLAPEDLLDKDKEGPLPMLARGMRAFAVKVDSGDAGFILPQTRVDIIAATTNNGIATAKTRWENVLVLAVDTLESRAENKTASRATTVTVEVTPKQAEDLALVVNSGGQLRLTLRPWSDEPKSTDGKRQ
jgi:Flp pilus assembly protein CpaB